MCNLDLLGLVCVHDHLCVLWDNLVAMWSLLDLESPSEAFLVVKGCLSLSCIFPLKLLQPHLQLLLCLLGVISLLAHLDVLLSKLLLVSNELITFCLLDLDLEF